MNVLVLQSELGVLRGGGENFTRHLFSAFASRGHKIAAAFIADHRGEYPIPLPSSIKPLPLYGWWSRKLGQTQLSSIGRYFPSGSCIRSQWDRFQEAICWRTIRWHDQRFERRVMSQFANCWNEYNAVYVHGNAVLASRVGRYCPTILRLPGPVSSEMAPILRSVHAVCANGDALQKIRGFLGSRAIELPIGLDENRFQPGPTSIRPRLGWTDANRVVGYVGRLNYLKGIDLLATAFRQISRDQCHVRLLIVGSGEDERNIRSDLSNELWRDMVHIERDVNHDELAEWYRAMDVLVMPSRYENFSNVLIEAMSCGIPFVASNIGGNKCLANTNGGWLFEPGSVSSLRSCLTESLQSNCELKARGEAARRRVRGRYNWDLSAERLEQIAKGAIEQ